MSWNYPNSESELKGIHNIKVAHSKFLKREEECLRIIYKNNKKIFRRAQYNASHLLNINFQNCPRDFK